jgi:hypothetical protein
MDVGEGNSRNVGDDLVGSHALVLVPDHDIEYTDAMARDAGFAAADAGRTADPAVGVRGHDLSIDWPMRLGWRLGYRSLTGRVGSRMRVSCEL